MKCSKTLSKLCALYCSDTKTKQLGSVYSFDVNSEIFITPYECVSKRSEPLFFFVFFKF